MHLPAEVAFLVLALTAVASGLILYRWRRSRGKKLFLVSFSSTAVAYAGCALAANVMTTALGGG